MNVACSHTAHCLWSVPAFILTVPAIPVRVPAAFCCLPVPVLHFHCLGFAPLQLERQSLHPSQLEAPNHHTGGKGWAANPWDRLRRLFVCHSPCCLLDFLRPLCYCLGCRHCRQPCLSSSRLLLSWLSTLRTDRYGRLVCLAVCGVEWRCALRSVLPLVTYLGAAFDLIETMSRGLTR